MQKLSKRIESIELNRIQPLTLYVAILDTHNRINVTSSHSEHQFTREEYHTWKRANTINDKQVLLVQVMNEPQNKVL